MIWSCSVKRKTPWEDLFNKGSYVTRSTLSAALYGHQWVKLCHIFAEQAMITLGAFYVSGGLLALKTFMWMVIGDECLF